MFRRPAPGQGESGPGLTMQASSTNGTIEDVATFFTKDVQTIARWMKESPPFIGHWKHGRNIVFGEDHVVECWIKCEVQAERLRVDGHTYPTADESARRAWREHLRIRQTADEVDVLRARIDDQEKQINHLGKLIHGVSLGIPVKEAA